MRLVSRRPSDGIFLKEVQELRDQENIPGCEILALPVTDGYWLYQVRLSQIKMVPGTVIISKRTRRI